MEAKDLRIGNFVFDVKKQRIVQIHGIEPSWDVIWVSYLNGWGEYKLKTTEIKPITLTEEWSDEINRNKDIVVLKDQFSIFPKNGKVYHFNFNDYLFIHFIQNLYFALTGEELSFNL